MACKVREKPRTVKWYTRLVLLSLLAALVLPFWLRGPSGERVLTLDRLGVSTAAVRDLGVRARNLLQSARPGTAEVTEVGEEQDAPALGYYRWQDAGGVWHFSDQPPAHLAETLVPEALPEPANSIAAPVPLAPSEDGGISPKIDSSIDVPLPAGVSREAIETLLEEAHQKRMGNQL